MVEPQKFSYKIIDSSLGMVDRMPYLPLVLSLDGRSLNTEGLLDTGVSVNVFFGSIFHYLFSPIWDEFYYRNIHKINKMLKTGSKKPRK